MDGTDAASEFLRKRFPKATDRVVEPTQQVLDLIRQRREAYASEQAAKLARQEAENRIKAFMGDAQAIPGLCTWKNNRGSIEVNHEGAYLELITALEKKGIPGVRQMAQEVLTNFTTTTTGARVLRFAKGGTE
ncbi:MAG: hypothetical protein BWY56_01836 [Acidobacteria bacterium ADurb.Bin340]|nr:MAG: hypothetical protein BWY56_01836 [Acidobacteria bacterium ADurb.Bin340]